MLSKFPNKTLKVGAKVSLSPQSRYRDARNGLGPDSNPTGVVGVVFRVADDEVWVKWEGQPLNFHGGMDYRENDYDLIAEGEPGYLEV